MQSFILRSRVWYSFTPGPSTVCVRARIVCLSNHYDAVRNGYFVCSILCEPLPPEDLFFLALFNLHFYVLVNP
jgi:hypothetical protein